MATQLSSRLTQNPTDALWFRSASAPPMGAAVFGRVIEQTSSSRQHPVEVDNQGFGISLDSQDFYSAGSPRCNLHGAPRNIERFREKPDKGRVCVSALRKSTDPGLQYQPPVRKPLDVTDFVAGAFGRQTHGQQKIFSANGPGNIRQEKLEHVWINIHRDDLLEEINRQQ